MSDECIEKPVHQMNFTEINRWAAGELILAIGEGKFRDRLALVLSAVSQTAYDRGQRDAQIGRAPHDYQ